MTLLEHLTELRNRLIYVSVALLITTAISFIFADQLIDIFTAPIGGRQAPRVDRRHREYRHFYAGVTHQRRCSWDAVCCLSHHSFHRARP